MGARAEAERVAAVILIGRAVDFPTPCSPLE